MPTPRPARPCARWRRSASAALATCSPRFATALAVVYVLFLDLPLSLVPLALREASVTYQVLQIAAVDPSPAGPGGAVAALVAITASWLALAVWRVRRVE